MSKEPAFDVVCLVRLGGRFLKEENIRAIKRDGAKTKILFIHGDDLTVDVDYDKVKALFPRLR